MLDSICICRSSSRFREQKSITASSLVPENIILSTEFGFHCYRHNVTTHNNYDKRFHSVGQLPQPDMLSPISDCDNTFSKEYIVSFIDAAPTSQTGKTTCRGSAASPSTRINYNSCTPVSGSGTISPTTKRWTSDELSRWS